MIGQAEMIIGEALVRLAAARGGKLDDVTSEVYLERLRRFDPQLVKRACDQWSDVSRKTYETVLPDVGAIITSVNEIARSDADQARSAKVLPMHARSDDDPTTWVHCRDCRDDFFEVCWCPGSGHLASHERHERYADLRFLRCDHQRPHAQHSLAVRCHCVETNPVIHARRQRERQRRAERNAS